MSAHGDQLPHYVTITAKYDEDGDELEPDMEFRCGWLYGACHFWPTCDCEYFDAKHYEEHGVGHECEHHTDCWMTSWFEAGCHVYEGEDADDMHDQGLPRGLNRSGEIDADFNYDYLAWTFKEAPSDPN